MSMDTPWKRAKKTRHELQEQRNGQLEGGSKQVNSGRFWRFKRDNKLHEFLIESRTTEHGSYRIEREEFEKIEQDAIHTPPGFLPGMQIDIQTLQLITLRLSDFQNLMLRNRELEAMLENAKAANKESR